MKFVSVEVYRFLDLLVPVNLFGAKLCILVYVCEMIEVVIL